MTVPASSRRAGPFVGTNVVDTFPFAFKVFDSSGVAVVRAEGGVETTLVEGSDYTVALNPDQDTSPGGTVTLSGPLLATQTLALVGNEAYDQETDLPTGGRYSATVVENALDKLTILLQQLLELTGRALTLPATSAGSSTQLPVPAAGNVIGWDDTASALRNIDPSTLASIVAYANRRTLVANGGAASYTLDADPGNVSNTLVAVGGVVQTPGVDYTVSGLVLTPTTPWPVGTGNVVIVYGEALPVGTVNAQDVAFAPAGAGAVERTAQSKLREVVSVKDFGAVGDGVTDDTVALQTALDYAYSLNRGYLLLPLGVNAVFRGADVFLPAGRYKCSATLVLRAPTGLRGEGKYLSIIESSVNGRILQVDPVELSYGTDGFCLRDFGVIGDKTKASQDGIALLRPGYATFENLFIFNCGRDNLVIRQGLANTVSGVFSIGAKGCALRVMDGIETWENNVPTNYPTNNVTFLSSHFCFSDGPCVRLDGSGSPGLGYVNGCTFYGCTLEYGYLSSPAGTGQQLEDFSTAYFPNAFDNCWFEANASKYHILKTASDTSATLKLTNCKHTVNGASGWPERFVNVTVGAVVDVGSAGTNNLYRTVAGSNAPYRVTKATARVELLNVSGCGLNAQSPWVEDETGATTGLLSNARVNNFGALRGPFSHYGEATDAGFSQYRIGDAYPFAWMNAFERSFQLGNGTSGNPDAGIERKAANVLGPMSGDSFQVGGINGETLRFNTGTANATVATTLGSVGPTGATAGNPQGWLRVNVAGTDRFVPYW